MNSTDRPAAHSEWIAKSWAGDHPEPDVEVEIKTDDGAIERGKVGTFDWLISEPGCQIVAYRITEKQS